MISEMQEDEEEADPGLLVTPKLPEQTLEQQRKDLETLQALIGKKLAAMTKDA